MQLIDSTRIEQCIAPSVGVAGTTTLTGNIIDLNAGGGKGALFVVQFGPIITGALTSIKVQHGSLAAMSDAADVAGTLVTVPDTSTDKLFYIDLSHARQRYVRLVVQRSTQNATVSAIALLYNAVSVVSQPAVVISGKFMVGADSGTA